MLFPSSTQGQEKPKLFLLHFDIEAATERPYLIYTRLTDCVGVETSQYFVNSDEEKQLFSPPFARILKPVDTMLIDTEGLHAPLPFLLLSIFLGSLYMVLFVAFLLLCLLKPRGKQFILPAMLFQGAGSSRASTLSSSAAKSSTAALMATDPSPYSSPAHENGGAIANTGSRFPMAENIPLSRKILIFLYVCFRAFTIFLFTFSVGLSVILSIESDSFKTLMASVQNAKSDQIRELASQEAIRKTLSLHARRPTASPWLQELRQIERASDAELSRQVIIIFGATFPAVNCSLPIRGVRWLCKGKLDLFI